MSQPAHLGASQTPQFAPGNVLAGRYRLEAPLGSGGMADVFRATDLSNGSVCAIKVLRANVGKNPDAVARLKREGEVLAQLSHPAIVRIESQGELPGGVVYLTMELLSGETLGARMRRGIMDPTELCPIVSGTCDGLAAAHAIGVVHRDLKPDNIFLLRDAESGEVRVKLLDFGISKVYGGDKLTHTGEVLGTPRYMSPEQLGAEVEVDPRIDAYSLGVILYEALTGKPPFLATTPTDLIVAILNGKVAPMRTLRPDIAPAVESVVMRAMARARQARFASVRELADAFLDAAGSTSQRKPLVRKGLATAPMGAMKTLDDSGVLAAVESARAATAQANEKAKAPAAAAIDDALQPGTFSAFGAIDELAVRARQAPAPAAIAPPDLGFANTALGPSPRGAGESGAYGTAPQGGARAAVQEASAPQASAHQGSAYQGSAQPHHAQPPHSAPTGAPYAPAYPMHTPRADASSSGASSSGASQSPYGAGPSSPSASRSADDGYTLPTRGPSRMVLIAIGLVAGAVTAAIVIGGLLLARHADHDEPAPVSSEPTSQGAAAGSAAAPVGVLVPSAIGETGSSTSVASGVEPPTGDPTSGAAATGTEPAGGDHPEAGAPGAGATGEPSGEAEPEGGGSTAPGHPTHRHPREPVEPQIIPPSGESDRNPTGGLDPLREAARALADGDYGTCVALLEPVIRAGAGGPVGLRRYADCLMRAGQRDEAITQYQRICRVVPDHPMVTELRELLAGMGRSCP